MLYLVGAAEEANGIARAIAEGDSIRDQLGLPPTPMDVLVVSSDAEAEQ